MIHLIIAKKLFQEKRKQLQDEYNRKKVQLQRELDENEAKRVNEVIYIFSPDIFVDVHLRELLNPP